MQTLLIPYLCWNLLYYVGYLAGSRIPAVADIVNRPDLQFSLKEMLEALFFYDYNPVFWFMYQLILLVALAPVIFQCMRSVRGGVGFLFLVMAGIFFHLSFPRLGAASSLNLDALFYYGLGAFGALHGQNLHRGRVDETPVPHRCDPCMGRYPRRCSLSYQSFYSWDRRGIFHGSVRLMAFGQ